MAYNLCLNVIKSISKKMILREDDLPARQAEF